MRVKVSEYGPRRYFFDSCLSTPAIPDNITEAHHTLDHEFALGLEKLLDVIMIPILFSEHLHV